jgi:cytochrome c
MSMATETSAMTGDAQSTEPVPATQSQNTQTPAAFDLADFGRTLYEQRCLNCHAATPGETSLAPPLHDVIGRRAGSAVGYTYSVKLAGSDLVWDTATLDDWLEKSTIATPDIRFRHVGVKDAIERTALLAYIASRAKAAGTKR